jgi:hypothetical protein
MKHDDMGEPWQPVTLPEDFHARMRAAADEAHRPQRFIPPADWDACVASCRVSQSANLTLGPGYLYIVDDRRLAWMYAWCYWLTKPFRRAAAAALKAMRRPVNTGSHG